MHTSPAIALGLGTLFVLTSSARGADDLVTVELRDGRELRGVLRPVEPSLFLLQADEHLYEIRGDEIAAVDGESGPPGAEQAPDRLIRYQTYERVLASGEVDLWTHTQVTNESRTVWTYSAWGARADELPMYEHMEVYDPFGRRLVHRIEQRDDSDSYQVIVDLAVPIVPGETLALSQRLPGVRRARLASGTFTLTFVGDFPEDRILLRKVELPRGAVVERVTPAPALEFEHAGAPIIVWRRYYPKGASVPLTIVYHLAEGSRPVDDERAAADAECRR